MTRVNEGTQKAAGMISDLMRAGFSDIWEAYGRPSSAKVRAWRQIEQRANETPGYNNDLHITGRGSHTFSTIYSFTDEAGKHIVKDTKAYTYITTLA